MNPEYVYRNLLAILSQSLHTTRTQDNLLLLADKNNGPVVVHIVKRHQQTHNFYETPPVNFEDNIASAKIYTALLGENTARSECTFFSKPNMFGKFR